ncbi:MAG: maleylpyruvate isomerase N-terminal domain-containing protein [Acidimicrobiales bacterium]
MSRLLPDDQVADAYRQTATSLFDLLSQTPESSASLIVPACPDWTVQQTVSHLIGVPEDLLEGRMEGITSDTWTDAQVQRHAGESLAELRSALEATISSFDAILPGIPHPSNSQLVMDALAHELDLREALGLECDESSLALSVAKAWLIDMIERRGPSAIAGIESAGCSDLDIVRALTGRRSCAQMDNLGLPGTQIVAALAGTPLKPPT